MLINKHNMNIVGTGEINFHDGSIYTMNFDVKERVLRIIVKDYYEVMYKIVFYNVFDYLYTSIKSDNDRWYDIILGWEEIPNEYTKDNFLDNIKNSFIFNGGEWDDELFAVKFLMVNISEIKIICKKIFVEKLL